MEQHVGTRTGTQIRSHAQKHFLKSGNKRLGEKVHEDKPYPGPDKDAAKNIKPMADTPVNYSSNFIPAGPKRELESVPREEYKSALDELHSKQSQYYPPIVPQHPQPIVPPQYAAIAADNEQKLLLLRKYTDSVLGRIARARELNFHVDRIRLLASLEQECSQINASLYQFMPTIALGKSRNHFLDPKLLAKWSEVLRDVIGCWEEIKTIMLRREDQISLPKYRFLFDLLFGLFINRE